MCILHDTNAAYSSELKGCCTVVPNVPYRHLAVLMLFLLISCLLKGEKLQTASCKEADLCYSCVFF